MKSIRNSVIGKVTFEKVAEITMPKKTNEWNEAILTQFYSEHQNIQKEYKSDVSIKNIDDKAGYGKGSVVVWNGAKKVNFPVIINDWKLSPMDVITYKKGAEDVYESATKDNIDIALSAQEIGTVDTLGKKMYGSDVKMPGGVSPKSHVTTEDGVKLSFDWKATIKHGDMVKFAEELGKDRDLSHAMYSTNPDLITRIIEEGNGNKMVEFTDSRKMTVDISKAIKTKQVKTIIDSDMFDVKMLNKLESPSYGEVRSMTIPTLEEAMASGTDIESRYTIAANGIPVPGVNIPTKNGGSIFLSDNGRYFKIGTVYGINKKITSEKFDEKVRLIGKKTLDYTASTKDPYVKDKYAIDAEFKNDMPTVCEQTVFIYGADSSWEAIIEYNKLNKKIVEDREVYLSDSKAYLKANVGAPTKVSKTTNPVYNAAIGKREIILIPETAVVINIGRLTQIDDLKPGTPISSMFKKSGIPSIDLSVKDDGIKIEGKPFEPLKKIASLNGSLNVNDTITAMQTMGISKEASQSYIGTLIKKASNGQGETITIFGVNDDYIDPTQMFSNEKTASVRKILKEYADSIKVNLVKEASVIKDPEAVDNILSVGFINEDNIMEYASYSEELKETSRKLAELLIAKRMGLKDVDETAVKKAIDGIENTIKGLNKLKIIYS